MFLHKFTIPAVPIQLSRGGRGKKSRTRRLDKRGIAVCLDALDHLIELVAVVSLGNVFEFAPDQIAVLFEEIDVPIARARDDHRSAVFLCESFRFLQKMRAKAFSPQRLLHKQRVDETDVAFVRVRDHARRELSVRSDKLTLSHGMIF